MYIFSTITKKAKKKTNVKEGMEGWIEGEHEESETWNWLLLLFADTTSSSSLLKVDEVTPRLFIFVILMLWQKGRGGS